jgi:uncharacterized protein (TIGR01777 family)
MKNLKIVIAGGTGFIGRGLIEYFAPENNVVVLTRNVTNSVNNSFSSFALTESIKSKVKLVQWTGKDVGNWINEINGSDIVINLVGKSVNCRYTNQNKQEIFDSRTNATKAIGEAIRLATLPPKVWINGSSATIYPNATDKPNDEYTSNLKDDFSVQVCKLWEKTLFEQRTPFTRKIALRMAITLGNGGVMVPYLNLCKFGLGGKQGNGRQMFSWVHVEDVCRMVEFIWENKQLEGAYNAAAPNPVSNTIFMQTLREVTGNKLGLPAFTWMLKLGAAIIGTETELLLKSRWVLPTKMLEAGYTFKYPTLQEAFKQVVEQMPKNKYRLF